MLSIEHTAAEGTLIHGTERGDGTNEILKAHRWRFSRNLGGWYVPRSRDAAPKTAVIEATAADLRAAGHSVEISVDATPRSAAEVQAERAIRAQERAEALEGKAQRKAGAAQAAHARADQALHQVPPGGEPVKVGHHSEARHRGAIETAHRRMGQAVAADQEAAEAARKAQAARASTGPSSPARVSNKINALRTEERSILRSIQGTAGPANPYGQAPAAGARRERLEQLLATTRDHLGYWEQVRAEQVAAGQSLDVSAQDVSVGDLIHDGRSWLQVQRVNRKSLTVRLFGEGTSTVTGRRRFDQVQQIKHQDA